MTARAQKMPAARQVLDKAMDEESLLVALMEAALLCGWQVYHVRRSDKALVMGQTGFPDVVLAKDGRVLFWELKRQGERPTAEQWAWLRALGGAPDAAVVTPADLDAALAELARP